MSSYEFTGKTVKEAIARACEELDTEEALLEVNVLEESSKGFLGLVGQRDARVRVRRREAERVAAPAPAPPEPRQAKPPAPARQEPVDRPVKPEPVETSAPEQYTSPLEEEVASSAFEPPDEEPEGDYQEPPRIEYADPSPRMDEARGILVTILELIPVEAEVESSIDGGSIYLNIKGDGSGLLIGKKGQTLDALQFLVNKIINKENEPGCKVDVVVDTENYRLRKKENLKEIAVKMSQKAKKTLKPVSFNPMPPHERRIIHLILAEDREVYTKSYGEGAMRRIIVYPRRGSSNKRRRR